MKAGASELEPRELRERRVVVAGAGLSGAAAARALLRAGAGVTVIDARHTEAATALERAGARLVISDAATLPAGTDLVVTSPGWRPDQPLLVAAAAAGVPVWGEPELAWRLRPAGAAPWLGVTGTNGKTTTVRMLESILRAAGYRAVAAGNVGLPLVEAVLAEPAYDVLAVELSSFQLHWSCSIECRAAAILNLAEDHVDWHGSWEAYVADKARIWPSCYVLYNGDDPVCTRLAQGIEDTQCFTLSEPGGGCLGVVDGQLVDRFSGLSPAEYDDPATRAAFERYGGIVLAGVDDVPLPGPHNVANALAAAGLARQLNLNPRYPVPIAAVRAGLRAFAPGPHRNALVATIDGVAYVDDSKATNPHAAAASLAAYDHVVWVAGGLLKGADVEELVRTNAGRLRAAVLLGRDRGVLAQALSRHAPNVPVIEVDRTDTGAMDEVLTHARELAQPGDTVLLAPAAASMDIFADYAMRGELFAVAARAAGP